MLFVIIGFDGPDGASKRTLHRAGHLSKLEVLDAQRRLVLAGPLTDGAGSLIVVTADSLAEVQALVYDDPYMLYGVFERVEIHPFAQVFPKPAA